MNLKFPPQILINLHKIKLFEQAVNNIFTMSMVLQIIILVDM